MKKFVSILCVSLALSTTASAQNTPVKNLQPTGDLGPLVTALESARLYPVFLLPMGTGFYDFELKASVTNWASGDMVYFVATATDVQPQHPAWDAAPKIFFTLGASAETRAWRLANPAAPLYGQLGASPANARINQLLVIPSKITGSDAWMYKGNTHLVWSYVRITAVGPETDAAGHVVWNPIVPVDWRSAQTTP